MNKFQLRNIKLDNLPVVAVSQINPMLPCLLV